ncbi:hypothetical protein HNQ80_001025 [Anaerosolibacter carboniphilus]|uniref:Uncharacterized protein n=1 Tax=Anaerosolibacter carboniphilus TaxID=1417629 RepID=A0A841KSB8_9FIRM|nr:hypothetical protein [Anaerosolibacter carboniphilus]MBB6214940.1 hypothetical protein [Anaerosolibacter carboniphilus]
MEIMPLKDIIFAMVPEVIFAIAFPLVLFEGKEIKKMFSIKMALKLIISIAFITYTAFKIRTITSNIVYINLSSTFTIALVYGFLGFNIRRSLFSAGITMMLVMVLETFVVPAFTLIFKEGVQQNGILYYRLQLSIINRTISFLIICFLYLKDIRLKRNVFFRKKWDDLTPGSKYTAFTLITFLLCSLFINTRFSDIYIRQKDFQSITFTEMDLLILFIIVIYFLYSNVSLLRRTLNYETFMELYDKEPIDLHKEMLLVSSNEEIEEYYNQIIAEKLKRKGVKEDEKEHSR